MYWRIIKKFQKRYANTSWKWKAGVNYNGYDNIINPLIIKVNGDNLFGIDISEIVLDNKNDLEKMV